MPSLPAPVKKVVSNPQVKKAAAALLLAILAALGLSLSSGCASLQNVPAQRARVDKFECQAAALAPLTDPLFDTEQLLLDLYAGKADLGQVLGSLDATQAEVKGLLDRLSACEGPPPEPAQEVDL